VNGELAQLCALVSHGNAFLTGHAAEPLELFPANRTFDYVRSVHFVLDEDDERDGTSSWLEAVRARGCDRMSLAISRATPTFAVAFVGGGDWHVHADGGSRPGAWYGSWHYDREFKKQPWEVTYVPITCAGGHERTSMHDAWERLSAALDAAETFDRAADVGFVESFVRARELLAALNPETRDARDLLPEVGYGLEARQLLAAGATAWVFGGMGWWNDFSSPDAAINREHEQVTQTLFAAVLDAVESAINGFET
jgi:hypothetical protein